MSRTGKDMSEDLIDRKIWRGASDIVQGMNRAVGISYNFVPWRSQHKEKAAKGRGVHVEDKAA